MYLQKQKPKGGLYNPSPKAVAQLATTKITYNSGSINYRNAMALGPT